MYGISSAQMPPLLTGCTTWMKNHLGNPVVLANIVKGINTHIITQTPGGNLYSDKQIRIDKGYVDNQNDKLIHCDVQINANPENATLKKVVRKSGIRGTHTKFITFVIDTSKPITADVLHPLIMSGMD